MEWKQVVAREETKFKMKIIRGKKKVKLGWEKGGTKTRLRQGKLKIWGKKKKENKKGLDERKKKRRKQGKTGKN